MAEKNGKSPEAGDKPAGEAKRGIKAYLPWILIIVLAPAAAWLTMRFMSPAGKKADSSAPSSHEPAHGSAKTHAKEKSPEVFGEVKDLSAPLTRKSIGFHRRKYPGKLVVMDVNGDALGEAEADRVIVNVAKTRGSQVIVARLALVGDNPPLLERLNTSRVTLFDIASDTLSTKTLDEVSKRGITNVISAQLISAFNEALGAGTLTDVQFLEFEVNSR